MVYFIFITVFTGDGGVLVGVDDVVGQVRDVQALQVSEGREVLHLELLCRTDGESLMGIAGEMGTEEAEEGQRGK